MDFNRIGIDEIGLSVRAVNSLRRAQIFTVRDLLLCDRDSLWRIRNLGSKTLAEINDAIEKYERMASVSANASRGTDKYPSDFSAWADSDEGKQAVWAYFYAHPVNIFDLNLSVKSYNLLMFSGFKTIDQLIPLDQDDLMTAVSRMDRLSAEEIYAEVNETIKKNADAILSYTYSASAEQPELENKLTSVFDYLRSADYEDKVLQYAKSNDLPIDGMALSNRSTHQLKKQGFKLRSDLIKCDRDELKSLRNLGAKSIDEILQTVRDYLTDNEERIIAFCNGDVSAVFSDDQLKNSVLNLYKTTPYRGYSFDELKQAIIPEGERSDEDFKHIIGQMITDGDLEYVDFRCYRKYMSFFTYFERIHGQIDERDYDLIKRKIDGETLESIGESYGITRERVRQIVKKGISTIQKMYLKETDNPLFDEDYYTYFYTSYDLLPKADYPWLGLDSRTRNYLSLLDFKHGKKSIEEAVDDKNLDYSFRMRVRNYINRNKLFIDDCWVPKQRKDLEEVVLRKYCQDEVTISQFADIYNQFLKDNNISDSSLYIDETVLASRRNRLADADNVLWKQNEKLRYYDMSGRDFTELFDVLNLDAYENTEISTLKMIEDNPEIMRKYDFRDQYELHNFLRKTVKEGDYHDIRFGRMPNIQFGQFDREHAIYEMMANNAPITPAELADLLHMEYGYDQATIIGTALRCLDRYYYQGVFKVDQKKMPAERMAHLNDILSNTFYYIDEIKDIYRMEYPDSDVDEVNAFTLKSLGFFVYTNCAIRNHTTMEAYFRTILTENEMTDITDYRRRFCYITLFSNVLMELRKNLEVIEFEPNQIITLKKLQENGISKEELTSFNEDVYNFVPDNVHFTIHSIRKAGFESDLFDLGFSDWFYANLLIADPRFKFCRMFNTIVFFKGEEEVSTKGFISERVYYYGSIDVLDLDNELKEKYGCDIPNTWVIQERLHDTPVYYDKILNRLYANEELYVRELDEEGL